MRSRIVHPQKLHLAIHPKMLPPSHHFFPPGACLQGPGARWGALTRVRLHVLVEVLLHVEVLAAPLAHELLVADVDAHVGAQLVLVLETLIAVLQGQDGDELLMSTQNTPHVLPQITSMLEQCRNHLFPQKEPK